jgi:hypothetical protein
MPEIVLLFVLINRHSPPPAIITIPPNPKIDANTKRIVSKTEVPRDICLNFNISSLFNKKYL